MDSARLFRSSCVALVATAMSFAIRGDIMGDFETVFSLTGTEVGWIAGAAFWGFGVSILFGGPLCDVLGMRTAGASGGGRPYRWDAADDRSAELCGALRCHVDHWHRQRVGRGVRQSAGGDALLPGQDDEAGRAACAWFPGGIVIGGLLAYGCTQIGLGWQAKMLLLLVPSVVYSVMFWRVTFPPTESTAAGVSLAGMVAEVRRPLFLLIWLCMWLTAATELGPGQWVANIFNEVLESGTQAGIILLVWVNGIMYLMRQFLGQIPHRMSPTLLIASTAPIAAVGLYLFGQTTTAPMWFLAAALLAVGTAFWWPTMLGVTSERFPAGGAVLLAIVGASGSISTAVSGPTMGWINDTYGAEAVLPAWAILPAILSGVFVLIYLSDRAKGGYRVEQLTRAN